MKSLTDEAIVVGLMDYRESDRMVHLYSKEHGRISGVARGAKKSVKRFGGTFELFARLSFSFLPSDSLVTITAADPVTIYPGIRTTLDRIAHASYAAELVTALTPEKHANKRVFRILSAYLGWLDSSPFDPSDRYFFEVNLLNILGYRPPLESCPVCGASLMTNGGFWAPGQCHTVICRECAGSGMLLSGSTVSLLVESLKTGRFGVVRYNAEEISEADRFLEAFIASNISRALKSLAFLRLSP